MATSTVSKTCLRNRRGSTLAEFAPAIFILLLVIFFPVLDLISICFDYGIVMLLNSNQTHEASLLASDKAQDVNGPIKKGIPDQWLKMGLGKFVKVLGFPSTNVSYRNGQDNGDSTSEKTVIVSTTVVCDPFVFIPIPIAKIPGLNSPLTLNAASERPMEDPDNAE